MTLRELVICYDAHMISRWDHTAVLSCAVQHLQHTVTALVTKPKKKPGNFYDHHPYRKSQPTKTGLTITPANIGDLKMIASAMLGGSG